MFIKVEAVTDLFSLTNQYPRQAIRPHTHQSAGRTHWFLLPLKNYFFKPFLEVGLLNREHKTSKEERPLSRPLLWTLQHWRSSLRITAVKAIHTKELTLLLATHYRTKELAHYLWHCYLIPKKNLFSLWHKSTFCHKKKPFVVLQINFLILFSAM